MAHAVVSDRTPLKTIVGIFSNDRKAVEAMRSLDAAGLDARGILGLAAGAVVVAGFAAWGNLATNPVGLAIGAVGVIGGMAAIGFVIGRTSGRHSPDAHLFSRVVQNGGAIVSVQCSERECELAAQVLDGAGAREVRDEVGPEAV
jgi:hypothetical protein